MHRRRHVPQLRIDQRLHGAVFLARGGSPRDGWIVPKPMGTGGIEPLVGHLTCFKTSGLQSAVRGSSRMKGRSVDSCGGRDSNPHCREPHSRGSCQLGYLREVCCRTPTMTQGGLGHSTSRSIRRGGSRTLTCSSLNRVPLPVGPPGAHRLRI